MKRVFTAATLILSISLSGQVATDTAKFWTVKVETALQSSQVSLTNWAAGGESSVSGNALFNLNASYTKNMAIWANSVELAFGLLKQGDGKIKKTDDKIFLSTSYGYKASEKWLYNTTLSFRSQFANGYNYPNDSVVISKFLAPAYILGTIGMEYKPDANFSLIMAPASGRITIVTDDTLSSRGAFGVEPGKKMRFGFGANVTIMLKGIIMENVDYSTSLQLFSNYLDNPQNIDILWELFLNMKINDFLSANLSANMIYDDNVSITDKDGNTGPRIQFKEVLGIGFSYKF